MLKPLIEKANKKAKIKKALADGAFNSRENFNYLSQMGNSVRHKVMRNSLRKARLDA